MLKIIVHKKIYVLYTCQVRYLLNYIGNSGNSGNPGNLSDLLQGCSQGTPYRQPGGSANQPQICGANGLANCPNGYLCRGSTVGGVNICCSSTTVSSGTCPNSIQPYYVPGTTTPFSCILGANNCPTSYTCVSVSSVCHDLMLLFQDYILQI